MYRRTNWGNIFKQKIDAIYYRDEYHWHIQFNLTSWWLFFIEKGSCLDQGIVCLWWILHRINIYYFTLHLLLTFNYFIFKLIMLIKINIRLKNYVFQFTETLNEFFYLSRTNGDFETFMCLFDLSNWKNQSSFEVLSLVNILMNGHCLKNVKDHVQWKLLHVAIQFLHDCHL